MNEDLIILIEMKAIACVFLSLWCIYIVYNKYTLTRIVTKLKQNIVIEKNLLQSLKSQSTKRNDHQSRDAYWHHVSKLENIEIAISN